MRGSVGVSCGKIRARYRSTWRCRQKERVTDFGHSASPCTCVVTSCQAIALAPLASTTRVQTTPPAIASATTTRATAAAALRVDVNRLAVRLRVEEPRDHEVRDADTAVRGRVGRYRVASVDGVAAEE